MHVMISDSKKVRHDGFEPDFYFVSWIVNFCPTRSPRASACPAVISRTLWACQQAERPIHGRR